MFPNSTLNIGRVFDHLEFRLALKADKLSDSASRHRVFMIWKWDKHEFKANIFF
jgi:hypothetical protein